MALKYRATPSGTTVQRLSDGTWLPAQLVQVEIDTDPSILEPYVAPFPVPDFGSDPENDHVNAVTNLRTYLGLASPTQAQTIAALKLAIRVVLFCLRRLI